MSSFFEAELSDQARRVAERELRETPERKKEAIAELRRLLDQEKDLTYPDNEFWLVKFLRKCKYYPESALEMAGLGISINRRDHKGRRILLGCVNRNIEKMQMSYGLKDLIYATYLLFEMLCTEPDTQVNGVVAVVDLKELSLKHLKDLTPSIIQFLIRYGQHCNPLRLKGLHVLNESSIIDATYTIAKNFLTEKLRKRIYFHGNDLQSLHEYVPPSCLPKIYGGTIDVNLHEWAQIDDLAEQLTPIMNIFHKEITAINAYGEHPEYFYNFNINYYVGIANMKMGMVSPRRDHKGRRVLIGRIMKDFDLESYSIEELFKGANAGMEVVSTEPDTQVNGIVGIIDLQELSLKHLKPLSPSLIRFAIKFSQDCVPLRIKGIHVLNESSIIDATYTIIKNFLSEKLRNRIYFHGNDYQSLHEFVPPNCLPKIYGGTIDIDPNQLPSVEELLDQFSDFVSMCEKELEIIQSYGYKRQDVEDDLIENTPL
uniref:CRAL-TRIO domain-containing protein n=1 Tax=Lutzomyia longipalpis TaxID=7200 RepID=A0A1B0FV39_LUTLO